jgi:hypothetical protein
MIAWSKFGEKPSKITIYESFETDKFYSIITNDLIEEKSNVTEIFLTNDEESINTRYFLKLTDDIFISFTCIEENKENALITEVTFYYNSKSREKTEELVEKIKSITYKKEESEFTDSKYNYVTLNANGLSLEPYEPLDIDLENIEFYYNTETIKESKKLIKKIKNTHKGISILYGERGTGKTSLIDWITSTIDKKVIQLPSSSIDVTINNPEFIQSVKNWSDSILILDDVDPYFNSMYRNSSLLINNLLQLVDGFLSDDLGLHIILIFNDEQTDEELETSPNFISKIKLDYLSKEKGKELAEFLEIKGKVETDIRLSDVISKRFKVQKNQKVGF